MKRQCNETLSGSALGWQKACFWWPPPPQTGWKRNLPTLPWRDHSQDFKNGGPIDDCKAFQKRRVRSARKQMMSESPRGWLGGTIVGFTFRSFAVSSSGTLGKMSNYAFYSVYRAKEYSNMNLRVRRSGISFDIPAAIFATMKHPIMIAVTIRVAPSGAHFPGHPSYRQEPLATCSWLF
jgi:hypothetical protein